MVVNPNVDARAAIATSVETLRRLAGYTLPAELDRRMTDLAERKEDLDSDERAELLAWVEFTEQRSIEKFGASLALQRLAELFPDLTLSS